MAFNATKAIQNRVILVTGSEDALKRDAIRAIERALSSEDQDYEPEVVVADQRRPKEWAATASSVPFIAARRVVIVRNLLRVDPNVEWDVKPKSKDHPFAKELASLPETALLLLVADDETGDEDKQRRFASISTRWVDVVKTTGGIVAALDAERGDIAGRLRQTAKERGKHLSQAAANLLVEMTGGSLTIALAELEKTLLFVGDSDTVTESVIRSVVAPEQEYSVFQLVDAIVAGDASGALSQLRTLAASVDRIETQAFGRVFPTLGRQFRVIWQARLCHDANCSSSDPTPTVLAMLPEKPRINDEPHWRRTKATAAARRISLEQITGVFNELVTADARMKGMAPAYSTSETVEQMVLNMTAICRGRN